MEGFGGGKNLALSSRSRVLVINRTMGSGCNSYTFMNAYTCLISWRVVLLMMHSYKTQPITYCSDHCYWVCLTWPLR